MESLMASPVEKLDYVSDTYAKYILRGLHKLLHSCTFCDITLDVESRLFPAHKNVLSAASPYFQAMFDSGLAEQDKVVVHIHGISHEIFKKLLDFIYTGSVVITEDNCQDLLSAADMLGLSDVIEICCTFLEKQLHPTNCLGIWLFADAHGCADLRTASETYILNHFLQVVEEEEFNKLPCDLLVKFLQSETLQIENEFQAFQAAMSWLLHDVSKRRRFVFTILGPIRFPIISTKQLEKYIEECEDLSLKIAIRKLVQDYRYDRGLPFELRLNRIKPYLFQPRKCAKKNIYVLGGYLRHAGGRWSDSQSLATVDCFNTFHQTWRTVTPLRHARSGHGACVLQGLIYVIGGESDSLIFSNAESYDPASCKWLSLAPMTMPRCGLGVCVVHDSIYAVGGWIGSEIGDTIECYNPQQAVWTIVGKITTLRYAMGVVQYEGLIYVIGGMSDLGTEMQSVESYNPVTKEWNRLANMNTCRAYVGVAVLDGSIYAVGGWNEDSGALHCVEKYNIEKDAWSEVPRMSVARAGASATAVGGLLYVIGGRTSPSDIYHVPYTLNSVECYDPQTEHWFEIGPMPTSRCEAVVVVI